MLAEQTKYVYSLLTAATQLATTLTNKLTAEYSDPGSDPDTIEELETQLKETNSEIKDLESEYRQCRTGDFEPNKMDYDDDVVEEDS